VKGFAVRKSILLCLAALPSLALASGYSLPNTNPRDLGVSGSAVAAQRDAGAAFTLPAALARLDGTSIRLGAGSVNVFNDWQDPGTAPDGQAGSYDLDLQYTPIGWLAASYGGKLAALGNRGWGAGISIQPFGGAVVAWPEDWTGRYRIIDVDRRSFSGVASVGLEILPRVRIGGGLVYYYTTQDLSQKFCVSCATGAPLPDATGRIELDGGAFSFDVSAEIEPLAGVPLTIGVDYKHKATQELEGEVRWTGVPAALAAGVPLLRDQDAKQQLTIPNSLNIGAAYRVTKPLLVTFTYTLDRWVVYDGDTFVGSEPGAVIQVQRDYRNGYTLRGGVEYAVSPALEVRAGLQRDVSGLRTRTYSPTLPDASSWAGSLGATYRFGAFYVDGALFYANMDEVKSTDAGTEPSLGDPAPSGTFRGTYDPQALVYGLAVGWTPGASR
jgi:long-chain fatty acid transport protein